MKPFAMVSGLAAMVAIVREAAAQATPPVLYANSTDALLATNVGTAHRPPGIGWANIVAT